MMAERKASLPLMAERTVYPSALRMSDNNLREAEVSSITRILSLISHKKLYIVPERKCCRPYKLGSCGQKLMNRRFNKKPEEMMGVR